MANVANYSEYTLQGKYILFTHQGEDCEMNCNYSN